MSRTIARTKTRMMIRTRTAEEEVELRLTIIGGRREGRRVLPKLPELVRSPVSVSTRFTTSGFAILPCYNIKILNLSGFTIS